MSNEIDDSVIAMIAIYNDESDDSMDGYEKLREENDNTNTITMIATAMIIQIWTEIMR